MDGKQKSERLFMRTDPEFIARVDDWRRLQPVIPSRSEAVRRLVDLGLSSGPGAATIRAEMARLWEQDQQEILAQWRHEAEGYQEAGQEALAADLLAKADAGPSPLPFDEVEAERWLAIALERLRLDQHRKRKS